MGGLNLANVRQVARALDMDWDESLIRKVTIIARYHLGENLKDLLDGEEVGD